ncbi:MAG: neutral/alkaline non-lysosomal ceramidase N-terminal domain-containing protein [Planctomycetaceae bacterium]
MRLVVAVALVAVALSPVVANEDVTFQAGFARVDATPSDPVRLSGYGNRDKPSEGVDTPLHIRAVALRPTDGETFVLVSFDTIGTAASFTDDVAARLKDKYGIDRERFVLCCTHSHTAPHLSDGLTNLFAVPLSETEQKAARTYTEGAKDAMVEAVGKAIDDLKPAQLSIGSGKAGFAINRRSVKDGVYQGFGIVPGGAVDHHVGVLKIAAPDGTLRGVVFNYACHATTLEGNYYNVNGDWPAYAASDLEETHPGVVALCSIGCGADANPEPRGGPMARAHAEAHGRALALEVDRVLKGDTAAVTAKPIASFGFAGLPFDRWTIEEMQERTKSTTPQVARHAQNMLAINERMGRLPETYPMPVQAWRFGDELTMVFLGGEVVVDYLHRLRKEVDSKSLWVTAYANDVFAYVASDRVLKEGGYEAEFSMVYYNQPGPWKPGTEEILIGRIHDVLKDPGGEPALSPEDAKQTFRLPDGYSIELVASEPLIADPVNFSFGPDGRLWVAEMGDYPRGGDGKGSPNGRIKVLTDTDHDGVFDKATTFLDGLAYPNGVMPWRDGALVSCVPDVFFAKDTDGDGKADTRDVLLTGFPASNPQHRVNGFTFAFDGLVHVAHGAPGITSPKTGKSYDLSGRDFAIDPDTGEVVTQSGDSQFGRCRDDFGHWFGNNNSRPLFDYIVEDHYLGRNPHVVFPDPRHYLIGGDQLRVHPASRTVDRFNDPNSANRFTSACSPAIFRDATFGPQTLGFSCEPVHNLVRAVTLEPDGATFTTASFPSAQTEFLASTDPWFRPVRLATGPDGALWVADMYRLVIEHPEWIPEAWQARLDLRSGSDKGRLWRVRGPGHDDETKALPDLTALSTPELVAKLDDANGIVRDLAEQLLIWRNDAETLPLLKKLAREANLPQGRVHALGTLSALDALDAETLQAALGNGDPRVVRFAVRMSEPLLDDNLDLGSAVCKLATHDDARVRMQVALSLGEWNDERAGETLGRLAAGANETWMRAATLSSASPHADRMLTAVLRQGDAAAASIAADLVATALGTDSETGPQRVLRSLATDEASIPDWQIAAVVAVANAVPAERCATIANEDAVKRTLAVARKRLADASAPPAIRGTAVGLLGGPLGTAADRHDLLEWLGPQSPPALQDAVVEALAKSGDAETPSLLLAGWASYGPRLRGVVLQALLARPAWTAALLDAASAGTLAAGDFDAASRERLTKSSDAAIRKAASDLFGSAATSDRVQLVAKWQSELPAAGDAVHGKALFEKTCASCHKLDGVGKEFGPNLAVLTDKSPTNLLASLLDPNKAVEAKYRGYAAVTADGRVLTGLVLRESAGSITLAGADGRTVELLRKDVEELQDTGKSFMPEGLERDLSPQDVADVIAFVRGAE